MSRKGCVLPMVLLMIAAHWVVKSPHASAAAGPGTQSLEGEEALRFLEETGMLESVLAGIPPQGRPFMPMAQVTGSDGAAGDHFGYSVALAGDTALVGADRRSR
jgi:hypothetical protein